MRHLLLLACCWVQLLSAQTARAVASFSVDHISDYPTVTFPVVFHFVARADGLNFAQTTQDSLLLAHDGHEKLRAEIFMYYVLRELNGRFSSALLDAPTKDTRIRFVYRYPDRKPLRGARFYGYRDPVNYVADALNIVITPYRGRGSAPSGSTPGTGSNRIFIYNILERYLRGSHDTWMPARIIAHEFGHTCGLDHTFKCDNPCAGVDLFPEQECYGRCTTNNTGSTSAGVNCHGGSARELIMAYGSQVHLTRCELEQLWNYLITHPAPYQHFDGPLPAVYTTVPAPY